MLVSKISTPTKGLKEWARLFHPSEKGHRIYSSRKLSWKQRMASAALALYQSGPWTFQPPEPSGINPPAYKHSHLQHFVKAKWNEEVGPCVKGRAGHNRKTSMSIGDWNVQPTPDFQKGNQAGTELGHQWLMIWLILLTYRRLIKTSEWRSGSFCALMFRIEMT